MTKEQNALAEERGKIYGDYGILHDSAAKTLQGLLEVHFQQQLPGNIPGSLICSFMASLKLLRSSVPRVHHEDNYRDALVYTEFSDQLKQWECDE